MEVTQQLARPQGVYVQESSSGETLYKLPGHAGSVGEGAFHPSEPIVFSSPVRRDDVWGRFREDVEWKAPDCICGAARCPGWHLVFRRRSLLARNGEGGQGGGGAVFQQPRVSRFTRTTEASFPWPLKATYHISGTGFFTSSFGGKKDFLKGTDIGWFVVSNPGWRWGMWLKFVF